MKNIFKREKNLYFLTKHSQIPRFEERVVLILSPQFYWVKKESLPVKRVYEAKKLAPSVFDGFLPEGNYSYIVYKDGEDFILIAYDKEDILKNLQELGIDIADIEEIRFAQTELGFIESCIEIDERSALANINGIIVQLPRKCAEPSSNIYDLLSSIELSKYKVKLSVEDMIDIKSFIPYAAVFVLLAGAFLTEYVAYKKAIKEMEAKKEKILTRYKLPRTSIQLRSIKSSLINTYNTQKKIRDVVSYLGSFQVVGGEYISMISVEKNRADFSIKISSPKRKSDVINYVKKRYKVLSESQNGDILSLKIGV